MESPTAQHVPFLLPSLCHSFDFPLFLLYPLVCWLISTVSEIGVVLETGSEAELGSDFFLRRRSCLLLIFCWIATYVATYVLVLLSRILYDGDRVDGGSLEPFAGKCFSQHRLPFSLEQWWL